MSWNYRIMQATCEEIDEVSFSIHETYYDDAGLVTNWSKHPIGVSVDDLSDIPIVLERMKEALKKPILCYQSGKEIS